MTDDRTTNNAGRPAAVEALRLRLIDLGGFRTYKYPESSGELWVMHINDLAALAQPPEAPAARLAPDGGEVSRLAKLTARFEKADPDGLTDVSGKSRVMTQLLQNYADEIEGEIVKWGLPVGCDTDCACPVMREAADLIESMASTPASEPAVHLMHVEADDRCAHGVRKPHECRECDDLRHRIAILVENAVKDAASGGDTYMVGLCVADRIAAEVRRG